RSRPLPLRRLLEIGTALVDIGDSDRHTPDRLGRAPRPLAIADREHHHRTDQHDETDEEDAVGPILEAVARPALAERQVGEQARACEADRREPGYLVGKALVGNMADI